MKKLLNLLICFLMTFCLISSGFCLKRESQISNAFVSSDEIVKTQEIIGVEKEKFSGQSLKNDATYLQTPYDLDTGAFMEGYSITPSVVTNQDSKYRRQVYNKVYSVNEFTLSKNSSIFMWIYLPDELEDNLFIFSISFVNSSGAVIEWSYDDEDMFELYPISFSNYNGWALFEFRINGATKYNANESSIFNEMIINYHFNFDSYDVEFNYDNIIINDSLSFYNVFVGEKTSEKTQVIKQLSYVNYKYNDLFTKKINSIYLGDSFSFVSINNIFEFIMVGKYNLNYSSNSNNKYLWTFTILNGNSKTTLNHNSIDRRVKFTYSGKSSISIKLEEKRSSSTKKLIEKTYEFECKDFVLGNFYQNSFKIEKNKVTQLIFSLNENFEIQGDINFQSSDESVFKILDYYYDETTGVYYVEIEGYKSSNSSADLIVTASGTRYDSNLAEYKVSTKIEIKKNSNLFTSTFFYIIIGIYLVAILIFAVSTIITKKKQKKLINN